MNQHYSAIYQEVRQMRKIGDVVLHGNDGCCRICSIERLNLTGDGSEDYYVLEPLYSKGMKVYVQVCDDDGLERPMNRDEIHQMLIEIHDDKTDWISNEKERQAALSSAIRSNSIRELFSIVSMLYLKRIEQTRKGKKFRVMDEQYLTRSEKIINRALAYGIGVGPEEVPAYIKSVLEGSV